MPHLSLDSQLVKDKQVIDRVVDDETLLIHQQTGNYYSLNSAGTRIWESIDGSKTVRDITRIISSEFDVDDDKAQSDVLDLVSDLVKESLVNISE
jgi:hypothetical protein